MFVYIIWLYFKVIAVSIGVQNRTIFRSMHKKIGQMKGQNPAVWETEQGSLVAKP